MSTRLKIKQSETLKKMIIAHKNEAKGNEREVLERILWSEPEGRSTAELVKFTGLHRDTINQICGKLINRGLIRKQNKKGKYHLTEKGYGNNGIRSQLFKQNVMANILKWQIPPERENTFCKIDRDGKLRKYDQDTYSLFSFSNRIAAFILYTLIESTAPELRGKNFNFAKGKNKDENSLSDTFKERLAYEWVQQVIEPKNILSLFSAKFLSGNQSYETWFEPPPKWVMRPANYNKLSKDEKSNINEYIRSEVKIWRERYISHPKSEINRITHDKLVWNFKKIYPLLYKELELIRKNLNNQVKDLIRYQKKTKLSVAHKKEKTQTKK